MRKTIHRSERRVAWVLVLALLFMGGFSLAKERKHGARLLIQKKDGNQVEGELIAIKRNSLLIMAGTDVSLDIQEIQKIRIVNKSKLGQGLLYGLLIGAGGGALGGLASGDDEGEFLSFTAGQKAAILGIFFGVIGTVVGGTVGALAGVDETIELKGTLDPQAKAEILKKLRRLARISEKGL